MRSYVALLRGVNVGGKNILPMQEFRDLLNNNGCEDVATYIQSGNAVFRYGKSAAKLATVIADAVDANYPFRPSVMVRSDSQFEAIVSGNLLAAAKSDPKTLHVWTLESSVTEPCTDRLQQLAAKNERYLLTDDAFYLEAPSGIGRSKLAAKVEKTLQVAATSRNWRTMLKIADMLEQQKRRIIR